MDKKIGIMGIGMVGGSLKNYLEKKDIKPFVFDKGKNLGSLQGVNQADIVFICVPTPFNNSFDLSLVREACSNLEGSKIIVIKSTIIPGTTEKLQQKYPSHRFLFNPEFLTEATAQEDTDNPARQIVGFVEQSRDVAQEILDILPKAPYEKIMKASEAEMVKYFSNTFFAIKVIFANQMYELCQKAGLDYEIIRQAASADNMVGPSHLDVHHKGYRGYGGKCLPKDMNSLIEFAKENGVDLKLHKLAKELNNELMRKNHEL